MVALSAERVEFGLGNCAGDYKQGEEQQHQTGIGQIGVTFLPCRGLLSMGAFAWLREWRCGEKKRSERRGLTHPREQGEEANWSSTTCSMR